MNRVIVKKAVAAASIAGALGFTALGLGAGVANADDGPWVPWVPWHPGENGNGNDWAPWVPWQPWHGNEGDQGGNQQ
jgi:hypothetical protein